MAVSKEGLVDIPAHCKSTCDAIFHHGPSAVMSCIVNSVSAEDVLHMLGKTTSTNNLVYDMRRKHNKQGGASTQMLILQVREQAHRDLDDYVQVALPLDYRNTRSA
ncbi:hypothetical protein ACSS6W_001322 [Trichoderma asperelloides]